MLDFTKKKWNKKRREGQQLRTALDEMASAEHKKENINSETSNITMDDDKPMSLNVKASLYSSSDSDMSAKRPFRPSFPESPKIKVPKNPAGIKVKRSISKEGESSSTFSRNVPAEYSTDANDDAPDGEQGTQVLFSSSSSEDTIPIPCSGFVTSKSNHSYINRENFVITSLINLIIIINFLHR